MRATLASLPPSLFPHTIAVATEMGDYASDRHYAIALDQLGRRPARNRCLGRSRVRAIFASSVRASDESRAVTPLELFFDLVYVFAISQLSHHLVEHFDLRTGVETLVLALAVIYAWYMTAWLSNWLSPEHRPVQALLARDHAREPAHVERDRRGLRRIAPGCSWSRTW